ncbi:NAD(P)-binding protein [Bimuria novae-zelandiae CBS 107.79]|uniref:NAD(P)-binding protein n=1 Tax=Bimuria novae-zelandiae CBS 107.79 TaxID=1447943 RepID=A0A6A5V1X0_9PLEO|nr:NAD(P)-binding protein [Bimuria novae-zelandiae CBS 107.79]
MAASQLTGMSSYIKQSPPLDFGIPYVDSWVKDRTIIVTGGASGFGAGFARRWATNGATVILGDVDVEKGDALARALRNETGRESAAHFVHCDVTDWQSQVNLFKEAIRLSPHGGIDTVVANAGIQAKDRLQEPGDLSAASPSPPNLATVDVNVTGVLYTTHLACYWLPRNPGSKPCNMNSVPGKQTRDRHLLLLGSVASLAPIAAAPLYATSKHAVLGLFRSLRATSHLQGIRVNIILPYFIDTTIVPVIAKVALAGGGMGKVEDVVEAGTRLVADTRILGRGIVVGPKMNVKQDDSGEWHLVSKNEQGSTKTALWEVHADDFEEVEVFTRRVVKLLYAVELARGWVGWATDMLTLVRNQIFGQR